MEEFNYSPPEEYSYNPPIKYLFVGIAGLACSFIFGAAVGSDNIWLSTFSVIFCIAMLGFGATFLVLFFRKIMSGNLILGEEFIEIPGRWKPRRRLKLSDIDSIGDFDTYDHIIEIECYQETFLIEKGWMNETDFYEVLSKLRNYFRLKVNEENLQ